MQVRVISLVDETQKRVVPLDVGAGKVVEETVGGHDGGVQGGGAFAGYGKGQEQRTVRVVGD